MKEASREVSWIFFGVIPEDSLNEIESSEEYSGKDGLRDEDVWRKCRRESFCGCESVTAWISEGRLR